MSNRRAATPCMVVARLGSEEHVARHATLGDMTHQTPLATTEVRRAERHAKRAAQLLAARTVPDVTTDEMLERLRAIHHTCHTVAGMRAHDDKRKEAALLGIQGLTLRDELARRGAVIDIDCPRWCSA